MNKIISEQLKKVEYADLGNFNPETNTYIIKKISGIKIEEGKCYLIHLKPSLFANQVLKINWNQGAVPPGNYLKVDVSKCMSKMIKVISIVYDYEKQQDTGSFWSGWLSMADIEVLQKL